MNAFSVNINVEIHGPGDERVSITGPTDENGLLLLRTLIAATAAVAKQLKPQPEKPAQEETEEPQSPAQPLPTLRIEFDKN